MKLLVCISRVPDTTAKINFTDNNQSFDTNGVNFIVNPYDEWYALVRALELKEEQGGTVTILNVGPAENDPEIRKALAIGADDAVRINVEPLDSFQIAEEIATYAKEQQFDAIFFGKETINYNGSMVGSLVAEFLEMPYISYASAMKVNNNTATIDRDIIGGTETVEIDFPFALSAAKGLAEQRIPNMRGIMQARSKPLQVIDGAGSSPKTIIQSYEKPEEKTGCKYIEADQAATLWDLLKNEAKVM